MAEQIDFLAATLAIENRDVWLCWMMQVGFDLRFGGGCRHFQVPLVERTVLTQRMHELATIGRCRARLMRRK